jgi:hypothetical protein
MSDGIEVINHDWQTIRERPAMYFSPVCICALKHFIMGYYAGRADGPGSPGPFDLPRDFHDWVAYRLHFEDSSGGWARMLIERLGDGRQAFDRFFTLLDEYHARVPRVVATLSGCKKTYTQYFGGEVSTQSYPSNITLTAYNSEDRGLFVSAEGEEHFPGVGFCPSLRWFESTFGPCRSNLTIFDQAAIDRWASPEADSD